MFILQSQTFLAVLSVCNGRLTKGYRSRVPIRPFTTLLVAAEAIQSSWNKVTDFEEREGRKGEHKSAMQTECTPSTAIRNRTVPTPQPSVSPRLWADLKPAV